MELLAMFQRKIRTQGITRMRSMAFESKVKEVPLSELRCRKYRY